MNLLRLSYAYKKDLDHTIKLGIPKARLSTVSWDAAYAEIVPVDDGDDKAKAMTGQKTNTNRHHLVKNRMLMRFLTQAFLLEGCFRGSDLFKVTVLSEKINGTIGGVRVFYLLSYWGSDRMVFDSFTLFG